MKVTKEKLENSQVLLKIEAEPQETEAYLDKAYRKMVNKIVVPGFRKGKAPRFILERHIGKEALLQEALEKEVPELYKKALQEQQVEAIDEPDVHITKTEPVSFEAHIPVKPTVELGDYKSIRIARDLVDVKEADVEKFLNNLREQNALWEPVQRPVEIGDKVTVELQGTIEGKKVIDNKGLQLTLAEGAQIIVPGFAEKVNGMAGGEEKEFELRFPDDYKGKDLPGKTCQFRVKINDVKEKKLPEINDEFAKSLNRGVETLVSLKTKIEDDLKKAQEMLNARQHEGKVLEAAVAASKVDYPLVLEEREIDRLVADRVRFAGLDNLESYLENVKKTRDELRGEVREEAQKRVLNTIVLHEIAEKEKVEITGEDIDKDIENIVKVNAGRNPDLGQSLNNPGARESIKNNLRQRKTLQLLSQMATSPEGFQ